VSPYGRQSAAVGREQTITVYPGQGSGEALKLPGYEQTVFKAFLHGQPAIGDGE
jgi:hypothetical protein